MKYTLSLVWVSFLLAHTCVNAVSPPARYKGDCQLLSGHLYCFGGASSWSNPVTYYNDLHVLDLSKDIQDLGTANWVKLAAGFEANSEFVMAPSNDTSFFVVGGTGSANGQPLKHKISSYDINSSNWTDYTNSNASSGWIQTSGAAGTPNKGYTFNSAPRLYLFGGRIAPTTGANGTTYPSAISVLNMITGIWSAPLRTFNQMAPRVGHQVAYLSSVMVMVGGQVVTSDGRGGTILTPADMSTIACFDSSFLKWRNETVSGTAPSSRSYFTLTPSGRYSSTAFLYGGIDPDSNQPCTDTMFELSLSGPTNSWKKLTGKASSTAAGPGPLFGHSTVAYNAYTMLIINGVDHTGQTTNDVRVYDTRLDTWHGGFNTSGFYSPPVSRVAPPSGMSTYQQAEAVAGGVSAGGLVFIALVGLLLCRYVSKHQHLNWANEEQMAVKQEITDEPLLEIRPTLHHGHYADQHSHLSATNVSSDQYQAL